MGQPHGALYLVPCVWSRVVQLRKTGTMANKERLGKSSSQDQNLCQIKIATKRVALEENIFAPNASQIYRI